MAEPVDVAGQGVDAVDQFGVLGPQVCSGVARAAVVNWRRRHSNFPDPVVGKDVHPQLGRHTVVA
ncbi:hypothetical protein AMK16_27715 [Streptomyces sp. CB00455]|nr:hypothetical protein AMK16_27715 [Streptomyces sp. CB00455]